MSRRSNLAVADIFFALGDRTRLSVLTKLGSDALTATMLAEDAKVTRQAIVKHLQVLEGAGLVKHEKHGRDVLYVLKPEKLPPKLLPWPKRQTQVPEFSSYFSRSFCTSD